MLHLYGILLHVGILEMTVVQAKIFDLSSMVFQISSAHLQQNTVDMAEAFNVSAVTRCCIWTLICCLVLLSSTVKAEVLPCSLIKQSNTHKRNMVRSDIYGFMKSSVHEHVHSQNCWLAKLPCFYCLDILTLLN